MPDTIRDGSGHGYLARVTSEQRLLTDVIAEPLSAERSRKGLLYGTGTGSITLDAAMSLAPVLWLKNNDPVYNFHIQKLIFGWNGGSTNHDRTVLSFIKYQTGVPTGAHSNASPAIENISLSGAVSAITDANATAYKWDGTGIVGMTGLANGYLQIPNRLSIGNTSIAIDGEIILGQDDTMAMLVTPEEAGLYNVAIVYYKALRSGREDE